MPKIKWNKSAEQLAEEKMTAGIEFLIRKTMPDVGIKNVTALAEKTGICGATLRQKMNSKSNLYGKFTLKELTAIAKALNWCEAQCAAALGRAR